MNREQEFHFEKLDVYRCALAHLSLANAIIEALPRGNSTIADQFKRAAISIPLNIAEGQGRPGTGEAKRAYSIARGSATECAAILDVCRILGAAEPAKLDQARQLLVRIVQMLTKLRR